MWNISTISVAW